VLFRSVAFSPGPIARYQPEPITERTDITDVRFNLTGTQAAVGMADGRVILYDLPTETVDHVFDDFSASVTSLTFSPDGSQLLVSSFNIVTVLDMQTYEVLQTLEHPLGTIVNAVAISPQGTEAVTGSNNSALLHWDLATGEVLQELRGHAGEVTSVAFGPVTGRVLSGALDNRMILWDLNAGESLRVYEHASSVTSVAFSPVGNTVASGTQLGVLTVRNLETGEIVRTLGGDVVQHGTQPITKLAYGADGRVLVSGGEDQLAIVWSTFTGTPLYVFDTHNGAISGVDIDPNGRTVLTGSEDGSLFWWSIADDSVSQRFTQNGHNEQLEAMAYSPDGSLLVTSDLNGVLLLWDTQTAEVIGRYNNAVGSHLDAVKDLAFLPDGSQFVTASEDMTVGIWDVADDDRIVMKLEGAHTNGLHAVAVAPDGDLLLTGDGNGRVVLWDLTTGEVRQTLSDGASDTGHTRDVMSLTFNADGSLALSGSVDRRMILWDVASGEPLQTYSHGGRILGGGFSADETRVYSGGNDDTLAVWDRASGTEIERISIGQDGQERYTSTVTFHQANEFALVGRVDGSAVLIDLVPLRTIARYEANASVGNANQITSAAFRPDGLAASIGARNRVVLELRTLTLPELIEWTRANRYIPDLPCRERQTFNIPCEGDAQIEIDTTSEPAS
jgi:WD40 repeat protein